MISSKYPVKHAVDLLQSHVDLMRLGVEAHAVMTMRVMGMAGAWHVGKTETFDMVTEKPGVLVQSAIAASTMIMRGGMPDVVIDAAVAPIRSKTSANTKRLAKSGPKYIWDYSI